MIARLRRRPGLNPNRRSRRAIVAAVVIVAVVALVIGEIANDAIKASQPAALVEQRSFVAAVVPVIDESTALVPWLEAVRDRPGKLGRQGLFTALGHLVTGSQQVEQQYASIGIPPPSAAAAGALAEVFAKRLEASKTIAGAVSGSLGGNGNALGQMEQAAAEIRASDAAYVRFRSLVPKAALRYTVALPPSAWAGSLSWGHPALVGFVHNLSTNSSLRLRHDLTILALTIEPPVLRITPTTTTTTSTTTTTTTTTTTSTTTTTTTTTTTPGSSTSSTAPTSTTSPTTSTSTSTTTTTLQVPPANSTSYVGPTAHLQAIVVVANAGNVDERHVVIRARLTPVASKATGKKSKASKPKHRSKKSSAPTGPQVVSDSIGTFLAGSSKECTLPRFSVANGTIYLLTVTIETPGGPSGTTDRETVRIDVAS